jgi:carbon-monoxide dehydrogenase iron sulfur subunit
MAKQFEHIICDPDKCVACEDCVLACAVTKHKVFDPALSRIRNVRIEPAVAISVACRACSDPPCVLACPRNALSQNPETGMITMDKDLCDGCGWCIEACEFGAILLNPETKKVEMCDLCADLDQPQCIKYCRKEALYLAVPETVAQRTRRDVVGKLLQELVKTG